MLDRVRVKPRNIAKNIFSLYVAQYFGKFGYDFIETNHTDIFEEEGTQKNAPLLEVDGENVSREMLVNYAE